MLYLGESIPVQQVLHRDINVCGRLPWTGGWQAWLWLVSLCTRLWEACLYWTFTFAQRIHFLAVPWLSPGFLVCFDHYSPLTPCVSSSLGQVVLILASVEEKRKPGHFAIQVNL